MSSWVYATGRIQDPMPLIEKSRASCAGGRVPRSFIQVIMITGLNKLYMSVCSHPENGLRMRQGVKPPLTQTVTGYQK